RTDETTDERATVGPAGLRGAGQMKIPFEKRFRAANDHPIVAEEQSAQRGDDGNEPDVAEIVFGLERGGFGLRGGDHGQWFGRSGFHVIFHRAEHRENVLRRDVALDVVNAVENKAATFGEDLDAFADFAIDLVRRAEGQRLLRVHAAAPEYDVPVELALEPARVHAGGGALH